jgi:hypothetical protein
LEPGELEIGDRVRVEPVDGGETETMDPPIIAATSIVAECEAS